MRKDEWSLDKIRKQMRMTGWRRDRLFRIMPEGHWFAVTLGIYERINRQMMKAKNKGALLLFENRMAEDIIRFVNWYGEIPQDPFVIEVICSWVKGSKTDCLVDLGKVLAGDRLTRAQRGPYILVKSLYDDLMKRYTPNNPMIKENEVLVIFISTVYNLRVDQVREILRRGLSDSYISPFRRFSKKEAKIGEGTIWHAIKMKKKSYAEVADILGCEQETVRALYRRTKKLMGLQEKDSKGRLLSDKERQHDVNKMVEDQAKKWGDAS